MWWNEEGRFVIEDFHMCDAEDQTWALNKQNKGPASKIGLQL